MQSKKKHALAAERTELQEDKAKNNSERNAVMVRGRQLEELSLLSYCPSSLTTFLFSTTTKNIKATITPTAGAIPVTNVSNPKSVCASYSI